MKPNFYQFRYLLVILISSTLSLANLSATAYNTITIDGTNDFASDEDFSGTSGSTWYMTWDADNVYIGADNGDVDDNDPNKWIHFYFDTDPMSPATSGTGTTTGINYNTQQPTLPFSANYHFRWKNDNSFQQLEVFSGGSWGAGNNTGITSSRSGTFIEFQIPRANLGNPAALYFVASMINEGSGVEFTFFMFPNSNSEGYNVSYSAWYTYILDNGVAPDAAGNLNRILPVEFAGIKAHAQRGEGIELEFATSVEENNSHFEVERGTGNRSWKNIGRLNGAGTTERRQEYKFLDSAPLLGTNYYRIKQVDFDGSFSYSKIVSANWSDKPVITLYPNPTSEQVQIGGLSSTEEEVVVEVLDLTGKNILRQVWRQQPLNVQALPPGLYWIRLSTANELVTQERLIIQ